MKATLLVLATLFMFLLRLQTSNGHPNIISETCKRGASSSPNFNYLRCMDLFRSSPKSSRSSLKGLAVIATKLTCTKAKRIRSMVRKELKKGVSNKRLKSCLESCLQLYSGSVSNLGAAVKSIKKGRYYDANILISSVVDAPGTCEDGFTELGVKSSLSDVNKEFFGVSVIALGVTSMLQA